MDLADQLAEWADGLAAWNLPHSFKLHLYRKPVRNQYGTRYAFNDGSSAFVARGSASVQVRERIIPRNA